MAKATIETPEAKHALDPRIRVASWAVLAFLGWTGICVLVFIGFGAWLEAIGWQPSGNMIVSIFLYLVIWIGVPIVGGVIFTLADERFEEKAKDEAARQERIQRDAFITAEKAKIWKQGFEAARDNPQGAVNPYRWR